MAKIYSYVDRHGKSLVPPAAKPPRFEPLVYLAELDGRHYVSVKEELPPQAPEIELQGPLDLKAPANQPLAAALRERAEPLRLMRAERARAYPPVGDQLDALMKDAELRRQAGERLAPELEAILDRVIEIKRSIPADDLGLD